MQCRVGKIEFEARMPSLTDLAPIKAAGEDGYTHGPLKALCKAVVPKPVFEELVTKHPTCFVALGLHILAEAGVGGEISMLDEAELDDEFATIYVEHDKKAKAIYPDPDDSRGRLFPVIFRVQGEERRAIFRMPKEREIDALLKTESPQACKAFLTAICVHGDMACLEAEAPGAYLSLTKVVYEAANADSAVRVGKS